MLGGVLIGVAITLGLILINGGLVACLIANEVIGEKDMGIAAMVVLLCADLAGSWFATSSGEKRILCCALHVVVVFLCLLLYSVVFANGPGENVLATAALLFGGEMATYLLAGKRNRKQKKTHHRALL